MDPAPVPQVNFSRLTPIALESHTARPHRLGHARSAGQYALFDPGLNCKLCVALIGAVTKGGFEKNATIVELQVKPDMRSTCGNAHFL